MLNEREGIRPRQSRWIAKPRKPRPVLSIVAAFTFLVQFPNLFGHLLNEWIRGATLVWMTLIAVVGAFGLLFAARELFARRETALDHALMDGAFGEQYPVEITVVVEDKRTGTDRGVLWFADDLIGFSGEVSSFVLASSDFTPHRVGLPGGRRKEQPPHDALLLKGVPKASYVVVTPCLATGGPTVGGFGSSRTADPERRTSGCGGSSSVRRARAPSGSGLP